MSRFRLPVLLAAAFAAAGLHSAVLERDLGHGLVYERIHDLPGDRPPAGIVGDRACILDIRYVQGGAADGAALLAWLKRDASVHRPVILLANRQTSDALLAPIDSPDAVLGLVVVGPISPQFDPDIGLKVEPGVERKAYEALEHGATIDSLTIEHPDKPRNDEETLEKSRLADTSDEDAPPDAPAADAGPAKPAAPPPLIDPVLQRAIQLYHALAALRRV